MDLFSQQPDQVRSVSDVTREVKTALERRFPAVWIRGEISNLRRQASGHVYCSLKDAGAQLSTVFFRNVANRIDFPLEAGRQILAFGRISVYEPRGHYQLIVETAMEDGAGRLQAAFERLKRKLEAEGLFAAERKRPLPTLPRHVAIITSPTGAALRDFLSVLKRRGWTGQVTLLPASVQGADAVPQMLRMLRALETLPVVDLLVIGRGGGSLEDLWAFNEEALVRALAACPVPVISAVGHEIDFVLTDFVADRRAETPTAAAEIITAAFVDARDRIVRARRNLGRAVQLGLQASRHRLRLTAGDFRHASPQRRIERLSQDLDEQATALQQAVEGRLRQARDRLATHREAWIQANPALVVERARSRLARSRSAFEQASPVHAIRERRNTLEQLEHRLRAASIEQTLKRGFTLVQDDQGRPVRRRAEANPGSIVRIRWSDGEQGARLEG
ncbi:MAG: exodeoxyribonuclease VII large subunit [Opitutales bacterium]